MKNYVNIRQKRLTLFEKIFKNYPTLSHLFRTANQKRPQRATILGPIGFCQYMMQSSFSLTGNGPDLTIIVFAAYVSDLIYMEPSSR